MEPLERVIGEVRVKPKYFSRPPFSSMDSVKCSFNEPDPSLGEQLNQHADLRIHTLFNLFKLKRENIIINQIL